MGICGSKSPVAPEREVTLLFLGLDNSGKTTILANINGESTEGATPSVGFSNTKLELDNFRVNFFDVGGGSRLRSIWQNYYAEASGSIFVVDSSAQSRLAEAKEALNGITEHERMSRKPLLILANKQDCEGALGDEQISLQLALEGLPGNAKNCTRVVKCVGLKSANGDKADPAIQGGVKWLLGQIGRDFEGISSRVSADVAVQRAEEAQKRKERSERVRKIKEERERLQKLAGVDVEESDGNPTDNPFKPIKQAAAETAEREGAAKARDREIQEKLRTFQDTSNTDSPDTTTKLSDTRVTDAPEGGLGGGGTSNAGAKDDEDLDGSTSGLSVSSNSLTDVTPESHSSAESLREDPLTVSIVQVHPPAVSSDQDGQIDTGAACTVQGDPPAPLVSVVQSKKPKSADATLVTEKRGSEKRGSEKRGSEKRKRHSTLLNRLKARSKTAPLLSTEDQDATQETPKAFFVAQEVEPTDDATGQATNQPTPKAPPITESATSHTLLPNRPMQDLPDLPRGRIILPPLKVTKGEAVGLTSKVIWTPDDIAAIPPESIIRLSDPPSLAPSLQTLSS